MLVVFIVGNALVFLLCIWNGTRNALSLGEWRNKSVAWITFRETLFSQGTQAGCEDQWGEKI